MKRSKKNHTEDSEFNWALGLNRFSLRLMGIWPIQEDGLQQSRRLNEVLRVPFMILVMFFGLVLPQMYALTLVIKDLPLVIDNLITSFPALTSCVKLFFIWRNEKVLRPVMESVSRDWLRAKQDWELVAMRAEASRARLITILDYGIMASCYCGFVVAPLLGFRLRLHNNVTDYGPRTLLVQSYYPYDYSASPQFELTHLFQLLGSFFVGLAISVPDDYFGALVFHASAQFRILGANVRHFFLLRGDDDGRPSYSTKDVHWKFRAFVNRHVDLIKMVSAVEKSFSFVIAAQIFCMSIMVCCLGFQILCMIDNVGDKPTPLQIITLTGTLITMMIHTLVDCFASETLASYSADLFFDIYSSNWYTLPWKQRRCLVPMMLISLAPRQIRAGYIVQMSLATYCSIIKSTAGYISVLIAASGRELS